MADRISQQRWIRSGLLMLAFVLVSCSHAFGTYDPKHGRWLQRDPLGTNPSLAGGVLPIQQYLDGVNLYQYGKSNPVVMTDPMGGCSESKPPPPCQCCCALGLRGPLRKNPVNNTSAQLVEIGHIFEVEADVTYATTTGPKGTFRNCTLEWWEWMDAQPIPGDPKNTWLEQAKRHPDSKTFEDIYRHEQERAQKPNPFLDPQRDTITLKDPAYIREKGGLPKRNLYIGVKLSSAPKCKCPQGSGTFRLLLHQEIDAPGKPRLKSQDTFPPTVGNPPGW